MVGYAWVVAAQHIQHSSIGPTILSCNTKAQLYYVKEKKRPASVPYMQAIRSTTFQTPPGIVVVTMVTLKHKKL